jgi:RND family efflux transporter MFP subunit
MAGYIGQANVRAGDVVKKGDVMFTLDERDLRLERLKWASQRAQYKQEYSKALAEHDRAKTRVLGAQIDQAEAQIALVEEQLKRTRVTAPFDGFVVTGDLSQSLGAPVERGDILFQIAPLNDYRVILKVDEREIGDVRVGQTGRLALAGMPDDTQAIEVDKITPISKAEEGVNYFRVESRLTENDLTRLRPGMEGVGKIDVDQRKLIWIWTHKIVHWVRMFFWSWWP